jgi:Uma2 family endonuclease
MSIPPPTAAPYLCPELAGTLMTPDEFDAVEEFDEEYRYELVHGVLVVNHIPLIAETDPNEELGHLLRQYRDQHPQGTALNLTVPQQYVHTRTGRRLADRLIWAGLGRVPNRRRDRPTIVVEFVSARRRDRQRDYIDKRQEYRDVGIPEYWIIDRFQRTLTVIRNRPDGEDELTFGAQDIYATPLLPGFELSLAALFAAADRGAQAD